MRDLRPVNAKRPAYKLLREGGIIRKLFKKNHMQSFLFQIVYLPLHKI